MVISGLGTLGRMLRRSASQRPSSFGGTACVPPYSGWDVRNSPCFLFILVAFYIELNRFCSRCSKEIDYKNYYGNSPSIGIFYIMCIILKFGEFQLNYLFVFFKFIYKLIIVVSNLNRFKVISSFPRSAWEPGPGRSSVHHQTSISINPAKPA